MPVYDIPELPTSNPAEAMCEERWEQLRTVLKPCVEDIIAEFMMQLAEETNEASNPIRHLLDDLLDSPLEDRYDLSGWSRFLPVRAKLALAERLITTLGEAQLRVGHRLLDAAF